MFNVRNLIILLVIGVILWKLFSGDKNKKKVEEKKEQQKMAASGQMVKDPICGTYVSKDSDIRVREGEVIHNFCSYECRDRFLKSIGAGKDPEA